MLDQFHFLEPLWLLALIPLIIVFFLAFQANTGSKAWEKVIDVNLLPLLLQGQDKNTHLFPKTLIAIAWIISVIALADPVWEKVPRPVFQTNAARVLVLDLSNSMLVDDLKPNRLARARFKIEDILSREEEGQTGLVLFAGEAFTASPLTRDTETIRSMLKVLTPQIMPAQGSRADLGLSKAHELLKQAGITSGQVLLIADGISQKAAGLEAAERLRNDGHTVSVMAVGTETGGTLNFRNNTNVTIKLDAQPLTQIANSGGGKYRLISTNNSDLSALLATRSDADLLNNKQGDSDQNTDLQNNEWKSTGPFLALLLLPFAALAFRRGWLLNIFAAFLLVGLISQPQELMAAENESQNNQPSKLQGFFETLSKNKAQRANNALVNQQYEKALELSDDPLSKGSAEYKLEKYEEALNSFKEASGENARYNEGNTLAKLEKYEEAIAAYDQALKLNSTMQDALDNKKSIEDFLKKQQQQQDKKNQQGDSDSQDDKQDQQNSDSNKEQENQENSKSDSQSAKDGEEQKEEQENQFSDANKDLDKDKKEGEEEDDKSAQDQQKSDEDKKAESNDEQALANQDNNEESKDNDQEEQSIKDKALAEELNEEEKMAAEQWLRRIPDDPGGLLRRKFRHQYNQNRRNTNKNSTEQPW